MKFSRNRFRSIVLTFGLCLTMTGIVSAKTTGVGNTDKINVRVKPNSSIIANINKNDAVSIVAKEDNWYKVTLKDGKQGYIFETLLNVEHQGTVTGEKVNIRKEPSLEAEVTGQAVANTVLNIAGKVSGWYKVRFNEQWAWISSDFLKVENVDLIPAISVTADQTIEERPQEVKVSRSGEAGRDIVEFSKRFLGTKYVWGGASPSGFDCSGYTSYIMKQYGVSINRVAADQAKNGTHVEKSDLEVGDLVFFNTSGSGISHAGIYIGDGQFIHASSARSTVLISSLSEGYYNQRYVTARRVLK